MKPLWIAGLLLAVACTPVLSQGDAGHTPNGSDVARARIERIRLQKNAELDAEEAACQTRFAENDCLNRVVVRRRQMLADLKRQEAVLNEMQRQQKGLDQLQSGTEKAADHAKRQLEAQAKAEATTQEDRQKTQDEKVQNHQKQAKQGAKKAAVASKSKSTLDAAQIEKNREAYLEKQKALEKRRKERDQRLLEHGAGRPPLPTPQ
ncbi:MAG: hypothetical protein V4858_26365 [Pseudomonadota bacterium]